MLRVFVSLLAFAGCAAAAQAQYTAAEKSCLIGVYQEYVESSEAHSRALKSLLVDVAPDLREQVALAIPLNEKGETPKARMDLIEFEYLLEYEPEALDFSKIIRGWMPRQTGYEPYIIHLKATNAEYKRFAEQDEAYGEQVERLFSQGAEVIGLLEPGAVPGGSELGKTLAKRNETISEKGKSCLVVTAGHRKPPHD